jgi:hypothetical protein
MTHNVGTVERYARLAAGIAAAYAATRTTGWKRSALSSMAFSGIGTGLTGYCPISEAVGRNAYPTDEQGERDTELRRQMAMASALGTKPSSYAPMPPVTQHSDVFARGE